MTQYSYFVLFCVKINLENLVGLNLFQARCLLVCQTVVNGIQLIVGTTHIESREGSQGTEVRKEQVSDISRDFITSIQLF